MWRKQYYKSTTRILAVLLLLSVQFLPTFFVYERASAVVNNEPADTCPADVDGWVKKEPIDDLSYTYTVPDGYEVTDNCYKVASEPPVYGEGTYVESSIFNSPGNLPDGEVCTAPGVPVNGCSIQQISHASFKLVPLNGSVTIQKNAINDSDQVFNFTTTGLPTDGSGFTLVDDSTTGLPSQVFSDLTANTYVVNETATEGWYLDDITCSGDDLTSITESSTGVTIELALGEDINCVFVNRTVEQPPVDFCDPSERPAGMSIGQWLAANKTDGEDCFKIELIQSCGSFNATLTDKTGLGYEVRYVIGDTKPELSGYTEDDDFALPAGFSEDYNGGSVEITYYIVGPESDYLTGTSHPNIWNGEGITVTVDTDCEESIDFCDPSERPAGMSIAQWLAANKQDGADCFEIEPIQVCGEFDVVFTNKTPLSYEVRYVEGDQTPELANWEGDGVLPATFSEDYNSGSVEITYYIVGAEKDYIVGTSLPNIWDDNGTTVVVDTDCEEEPNPSIQVVKSGPDVAEAGTVATYTFTVTNTGDVALTDIEILDTITGTPDYISGDVDEDGYLDLDETWLYEDTYEIPEDQVEPVVNVVIVCGSQLVLEEPTFDRIVAVEAVLGESDNTVCDQDDHVTFIPQVLGATDTINDEEDAPQVLGALVETGSSITEAILVGLSIVFAVAVMQKTVASDE